MGVSLPLQTELHFEMYFPLLAPHPFFGAFVKDNQHVVRKVCHSAMSMSYNSMGDVIFHLGEAAECMILISTGMVKYTWAHSDSELLGVGKWLSEAILWTQW